MAKKIRVKKHVVPAPIRTVQDIASRIVSDVDLLPDYTELLDRDGRSELFRAYVAQHTSEDCQQKMADFEERWDKGWDAIHAALPPQLRDLALELESDRQDKLWIDEEVVYALGVEVGRRLGGVR